MKQMRRVMFAFFVSLLLVTAACGGGSGDDPTDTVEQALRSIYAGDFDDFSDSVCSVQAGRIAILEGGLDLTDVADVDLGGVEYQLTAEDGTQATVLVYGIITATWNGETQDRQAADVLGNPFDIGEETRGSEVSLVKEDDAWRLCDEEFITALVGQ